MLAGVVGTRCIWWDPEMSHADVLVCDGDEQEAGPSFSKYGRLKLCIINIVATQ